MGKPKYTQYTGEDLYQQCKRQYEGEYYLSLIHISEPTRPY